MANGDLEQAIRNAYRNCAEASVEHDAERARQACDELHRLERLLPQQRGEEPCTR